MDSIGLYIRLDSCMHTIEVIHLVMDLRRFDEKRLNITSKIGCLSPTSRCFIVSFTLDANTVPNIPANNHPKSWTLAGIAASRLWCLWRVATIAKSWKGRKLGKQIHQYMCIKMYVCSFVSVHVCDQKNVIFSMIETRWGHCPKEFTPPQHSFLYFHWTSRDHLYFWNFIQRLIRRRWIAQIPFYSHFIPMISLVNRTLQENFQRSLFAARNCINHESLLYGIWDGEPLRPGCDSMMKTTGCTVAANLGTCSTTSQCGAPNILSWFINTSSYSNKYHNP